MKSLLGTDIRLAACGLLLGISCGKARAQTVAGTVNANAPVAIVHSVRPLSAADGPAIEIVSSRPLTPTIRKAENPPRLVIDFFNARLDLKKKRIPVGNAEIEDVQCDQFQQYPPITRIVIDLLQPLTYSWHADGNRLSIHLHSAAASSPPKFPAGATSVQPSTATSANLQNVTLDGNRVDAGSSVTAGSDAAIVQLGGGGQVRVCPRSTISVTPSKNGRSVMLGMGTGAMEAHCTLGASTDSIITPDFRIQMVGPGEFDYAISADARGNTCVQALPGNTASVIVSELMGDGTYQVKPGDHVMFHSGRLKEVALAGVGGCGCPAPERPMMLASSPASAEKSAPRSVPSSKPEPLPTALPSAGAETAALPPSKPKEVHVQVDAPFVFHGDDPTPVSPPIVAVGILPLRSPAPAEPVAALVLAPARREHHGFFGKLRGFFAAVFS